MEFGDLSTLITIGIAVFIFLRLRSVLGKRTGHQGPPVDPYVNRDRRTGAADASNDNVVTLPRHGKSERPQPESETDIAIAAIAKKGTKLNKGLHAVAAADTGFDPARFVDGAKLAYEMIVTAYADGDTKTLKNLLSREVYEGFANAISDREGRGEVVRSSFVGVDQAEIRAAQMNGRHAHVTIRFVSQIVSATFNSEEKLVDGDPEQVAEVTDIWTFARDTRSNDPNWKLVATGSDA